MLTHWDHAVLIFYFAFVISVGVIFRRFVRNANDYFRGGARVVWWLAGGSAFMVSFSAWTFTGAAAKGYRDGWPIAVIFLGNALSLTLSGLYFAGKFRQLRVITPIQAIRERFGPLNEQIFTWLQLPIGTIQAGIWLNALAVFVSATCGMDLNVTLVCTGCAITLIALISGLWGVIASEFLQVLILLPVCVVVAVLSVLKVGGPASFVARVPLDQLSLSQLFNHDFLALWCVAVVLKQFSYANNLMGSSRYLCAKDSKHASKAAFLGAGFCLLGALIWFIPPIAASILHPNLATVFPQLSQPADAAYLAIAKDVLPVGMLGLLISGIFAATMSAVDTGLNHNAAIFIKNFYQSILRPKANERQILVAGKLCTVVMGALMVFVAWRLTQLKHLSLFSITLKFGALVTVPVSIPLFWALLVKKVPSWSCWSTLVVCCVTSIGCETVLDVNWAIARFGLGTLGADSKEYWGQGIAILLNVACGSAWFFSTKLWWNKSGPDYRRQVERFFIKLEAPVDFAREVGRASDREQHRVISLLCVIYGGFILSLAVIPNAPAGRVCFLFCGAVPLLVGAALRRTMPAAARSDLSASAPPLLISALADGRLPSPPTDVGVEPLRRWMNRSRQRIRSAITSRPARNRSLPGADRSIHNEASDRIPPSASRPNPMELPPERISPLFPRF